LSLTLIKQPCAGSNKLSILNQTNHIQLVRHSILFKIPIFIPTTRNLNVCHHLVIDIPYVNASTSHDCRGSFYDGQDINENGGLGDRTEVETSPDSCAKSGYACRIIFGYCLQAGVTKCPAGTPDQMARLPLDHSRRQIVPYRFDGYVTISSSSSIGSGPNFKGHAVELHAFLCPSICRA
jgi:hypothetical protein